MKKDKNTLILIFIAVIIILFVMGGFGISSYGMMSFGLIFMLLFWGLIIWLIINLINTGQSNKDEPDSLIILKKRYASGKITKGQFEKMKIDLREGFK